MRGKGREWTPQGASHSVADPPRVGKRKVGCWPMRRTHRPAAIWLTTIHSTRHQRRLSSSTETWCDVRWVFVAAETPDQLAAGGADDERLRDDDGGGGGAGVFGGADCAAFSLRYFAYARCALRGVQPTPSFSIHSSMSPPRSSALKSLSRPGVGLRPICGSSTHEHEHWHLRTVCAPG